MINNQYIEYSAEVKQALEDNKPIVAIETGGTFEGLPYPENEKTAQFVESAVREHGAVPAYIAIMDGKVKVGMTDSEIARYAKMRGKMLKASRREIPLILAKGGNGIMTIAATMMIADVAGISVVSGGGIGGVHRGAEKTMDISSDLEEFLMRDVIVVCSGAKSILDLQLTMEYMETKGVPVIGYKTDELPAYMARTSGIKLSCRMDSMEEIAKAYQIKKQLGINGGMLVTNPIDEEFAVDADKMNGAIEAAIKESIKDGVSGKVITAYLMKRVKEMLGEDSMDAQIHMIKENAVLGAEIAKQLFYLGQCGKH